MGAKETVAKNMRRLRVAAACRRRRSPAGMSRTYVTCLERELENPTGAVPEKIAAAPQVEIAGGARFIERSIRP